MKNRVDSLIELLFDNKASITERDEAATYLGEFSDTRATTALISKAKDVEEDELVLNSCGESLGIIWVTQNLFDEKVYRTLPGTVRYGIYVVIRAKKPEWLEQHRLKEDKF